FRSKRHISPRRRGFQPWPGHEPVGHTEYLGFRNYSESKPEIQADVIEFVGLQVRERAAVVHVRAEPSQHCTANSLALKVRINRYWPQMPVRFARIAARPLAGPLEHSHRRSKWVTKDH